MADIGNLLIDLRLNSARFIQGIDRVNRKLDGFKRQANSVRNSVRGLFVAAAGAGLAVFIKQQAQAGDVLAKTADALGDTTERLAAFQLAAAELSGVELEQSTKSLQRFVVQLGDAKRGSGDAARALKRLGLNQEELARQTPTEAFEAVGAALTTIPTRAEQARLAYALLGRQAVVLLNTMLRLGEDGLRPFEQIAKDLGIAVDRVSAAKLEQANDQLNRAQFLVQGTGRNLAIQLAPTIQAVSERFAAMGAQGDGAGKFIVNAFTGALRAVGFLANGFKVIGVAIDGIVAAVSTLAHVWIRGAEAVNTVWRFLLNDLINMVNTTVRGITDTIVGLIGRIENLYAGIADIDILPDFIQERARSLAQGLGEAKTAAEGLGAALTIDNIAGSSAFIAKLKQQIDEFANARRDAFVEALGELIRKKLPSQAVDDFIAEIDRRAKEIEKETNETFGGGPEIEIPKEKTNELKNTISDTLRAGASDGADGMIEVILRKVEDGLISQLAEMISKGLGGIFGGGGGAGGNAGGGIYGVLGGLFGAANGGQFVVGNGGTGGLRLPGRDSQLVAFRGRPGERVTVSPPGEASARPGGGLSVVINQNIETQGAVTAEQARAIADESANAVRFVMQEQQRRVRRR